MSTGLRNCLDDVTVTKSHEQLEERDDVKLDNEGYSSFPYYTCQDNGLNMNAWLKFYMNLIYKIENNIEHYLR